MMKTSYRRNDMNENIQIHKKKVKNVTLKVKRDGTIHLTVPEAATEDYV